VYVTAVVKSLGVMVLVCGTTPTRTVWPVVENVAIRPVTSVPNGTVAVMVCAASLMVATMSAARLPGFLLDSKLNAGSSFA
jgi:ATP-dependent protease ClpP protease subunit